MYNGAGLQTPRGSGTSGYCQSNKFLAKSKKSAIREEPKRFEANEGINKPHKEILEHQRKRQIELRLFLLKEELVDKGCSDAEISQKIEEAKREIEIEAVY
ncbi:hypothetical protein Sjap_011235 [Stephania japonica]|uniref:CWF21 domain-containing protein n=1 Tax=Stephania japonica TaxID=461633 RepID=A0AAP0P4W1_9MAGN